jgi:soluble lytic murein transglycosylase
MHTGLIVPVFAAALAAPQGPAPRPAQQPSACGALPSSDAGSFVAAGRFWHALRSVPPLPRASRPLAPGDALLQLRVAVGMGQWSRVDEILGRVRAIDTIPDILAIAARQDERAERWPSAAARYRRLAAASDASLATRATATVRLAIVLGRLGPPDSAAAAWRRSAQALPEIADWLALERAELESDTALAFATVAVARTPGAGARADDLVARRREAAGNIRGALEVYLRRGRPLDAARVELSLGNRGPARQLADSVLVTDPTKAAALLAANLLNERFGALLPVELIGIARAYRARGDPQTAERYARRALGRPEARAVAWLELAAIRSDRRQFRAALDALDSAETWQRRLQVPVVTQIARARVQALGSSDRWEQADTLAARLARTYPGDTDVAAAVLTLANHERSRGTPENERVFYQTLVLRFPAAPAATVARFRLALDAYTSGRADMAAAGLAEVLAQDTAGRLARAARYWDARLRLERGDSGAAAALRSVAMREPTGYYGVRARELLGEALPLAADSMTPAPAGAFPASLARERIALLARLGLETEARAEAVGWVRDAGTPVQVLLAAAGAAAEAGFAREAILLAEAARTRVGLSLPVALALFPLPYRRVIEAEATDQCVDPLLMAAIIRQESRFDPRAHSRAGARGLSQVMPSTGAEMSRRLGLRPWDPVFLYVPDFNLLLGARYVRERLTRDSLPIYATIASYDAGRAGVMRSRLRPEFRDPDLFVERLSVVETRDYVRNVYANYRWYRRLYATPESGR